MLPFFWMGYNFFGTRIRIGASPDCRGGHGLVRIFLFLWIWGSAGLVARMGGERRFAPLLRIAAARGVEWGDFVARSDGECAEKC